MALTRRKTLCGLALAAATAFAGPGFGQTVEEFYSDKDVTMMVSAPAGTLTDTIVRQFAQHYVKHIPGQPDAIVLNVAGAGGMVAAASLQSKQDNDGSVIGFLQRNNLYVPLLDPGQSAFDPREVTWLGSLDKVYYALVGMTRSGVTTAEDLFETPLVIGATGFANENRTMPALVNDYLGTRMKIIPGYSGRGEVYLAMERGEVDGWASTVDGLFQGEPVNMLADGSMNVLLHLGWTSHPAFPDVPNLTPYVTDPEVRALLDFFLLPLQAGRPFAVPAGVPQDRVDALRAAFDATMADPDFLAAMKAQNYGVDPISGGEVEQIIETLWATPAAQLDTVRQVVTPQG
ncbi:Bug family tripartite tricarboxylate transporter substrate binding protein [Puniceibacterium confluentis]|uniref:Bug family tripartite tricarboxylate transporter substrate binding protein n=1 Tax=Puniceibacterium confluentis TaxID=1958944 RepID=UPI0011B63435|nr:tripartite tricarboxylate transporter substrate-binding protein [Puniceibacterium confluentis]